MYLSLHYLFHQHDILNPPQVNVTYTWQKKKRRYRNLHFNVVYFQNRIKIRKLEIDSIENVSVFFFFFFSNSLLIICGVNQRPVSKSMFAILITVLSSSCFHYRCAASLILTVPGVTRVTIGIGQQNKSGQPLPSFNGFLSRPSFKLTFLQALF